MLIFSDRNSVDLVLRIVDMVAAIIVVIGLAIVVAIYAVLLQCPNGAVCADYYFWLRGTGSVMSVIGAVVLIVRKALKK